MLPSNEFIVKKASQLFQQGQYSEAKACYQQAARRYGAHLFDKSIELCDRRLGSNRPNNNGQPTPVKSNAADGEAIARQLQDTQTLLEQYYTRCQELEYKLMDGNTQ